MLSSRSMVLRKNMSMCKKLIRHNKKHIDEPAKPNICLIGGDICGEIPCLARGTYGLNCLPSTRTTIQHSGSSLSSCSNSLTYSNRLLAIGRARAERRKGVVAC